MLGRVLFQSAAAISPEMGSLRHSAPLLVAVTALGVLAEDPVWLKLSHRTVFSGISTSCLFGLVGLVTHDSVPSLHDAVSTFCRVCFRGHCPGRKPYWASAASGPLLPYGRVYE